MKSPVYWSQCSSEVKLGTERLMQYCFIVYSFPLAIACCMVVIWWLVVWMLFCPRARMYTIRIPKKNTTDSKISCKHSLKHEFLGGIEIFSQLMAFGSTLQGSNLRLCPLKR